jgi:hypothetical protein
MSPEWTISSFNNANTDRSEIREEAEIVHLCGAFERLFGYSQKEVVPGFTKILSSIPNATNLKLSRLWGNYVLNQNKANNIREAWIKDFYKTRNEVGHGKSRVHHAKTWDIKEHLLIGTYIFPIILKLFLEQNSLYRTTNDEKQIAFFLEYVLNTPHALGIRFSEDPYSYFWLEFIRDASWDWILLTTLDNE